MIVTSFSAVNKIPFMGKTNAIRILESLKIGFDIFEYEVDESDLSAQSVAAKLGQDIEAVFKTLVLRTDRGEVFVCVIPGNSELDLKKAAKASGSKKCDLVPMKEILALTGYIRGGCSPIGMKKNYPVYIDETCILHERMYVSAGVRGMQVHLSPGDLIETVSAEIADLV